MELLSVVRLTVVEIVYTLNVLRTVSILYRTVTLSIERSMVYLNISYEALQSLLYKTHEVLDLSIELIVVGSGAGSMRSFSVPTP